MAPPNPRSVSGGGRVLVGAVEVQSPCVLRVRYGCLCCGERLANGERNAFVEVPELLVEVTPRVGDGCIVDRINVIIFCRVMSH